MEEDEQEELPSIVPVAVVTVGYSLNEWESVLSICLLLSSSFLPFSLDRPHYLATCRTRRATRCQTRLRFNMFVQFHFSLGSYVR